MTLAASGRVWRAAAATSSLILACAGQASVGRADANSREPPLMVCADPNNMPFSDRSQDGFENKIAALVARDLGRKISYVWWPQVRGFVRKTLNSDQCDLWPGVSADLGMVAASRAYYRSTYVFVTRTADGLAGLSLDDPRLQHLRLGVQLIGNDAMNSPPAHAVASRGLIDNVHGYMVYRTVGEQHSSPVIDSVSHGEIDVALVWGPLAGYFAARSSAPLRIEPITPADDPRWPMAFDIGMGIRRGKPELKQQIDAVLEQRRSAIAAILRAYHVPIQPPQGHAPGQPD